MWRRCFGWPLGVKNVAILWEEPHVHHQQLSGAPPSLANSTGRMRPPLLWPRLTKPQQQALLRLLGELIQKHLRSIADKEVADESR